MQTFMMVLLTSPTTTRRANTNEMVSVNPILCPCIKVGYNTLINSYRVVEDLHLYTDLLYLSHMLQLLYHLFKETEQLKDIILGGRGK